MKEETYKHLVIAGLLLIVAYFVLFFTIMFTNSHYEPLIAVIDVLLFYIALFLLIGAGFPRLDHKKMKHFKNWHLRH